MALDFTGASDRLNNSSIAFTVSFSMLIRFVQYGSGGGGFGRFVDMTGVANAACFSRDSPDAFDFTIGSFTRHRWVRPAFGTPSTLGISFPVGSPITPTVVQNGKQMAVELVAGTASWNQSSYNANFGNRADGLRNWDGNYQDFALYNAQLTFGELMAFQNGVSPLKIRPDRLQHYLPFGAGDPLRDLAPRVANAWTIAGGSPSYTGGQVFPHFERNKSIFLPTWASGVVPGPSPLAVFRNHYRNQGIA